MITVFPKFVIHYILSDAGVFNCFLTLLSDVRHTCRLLSTETFALSDVLMHILLNDVGLLNSKCIH